MSSCNSAGHRIFCRRGRERRSSGGELTERGAARFLVAPATAAAFTLAALAGFAAAACGGSEKPVKTIPTPVEEDADGAEELETQADEDDGVEVEGLKGHLDPQDIETGLQPHANALAGCYENNVRKSRYIDGKLQMKYTVGRDGAVKDVFVAESDLGAWNVESCLLQVARTVTFKEPRGRGDADFSVPLDFSSGRAKVHWLEQEVAQREVAQHVDSLSECAELGGGQNPNNVMITLYVGRRGKVQSVGFSSAGDKTVFSDAWAQCAFERIGRWQLRDPKGRVVKLSFLYNPA
jgi:hypothetical protein